MTRAESILAAVQRIYDAALEPEGWVHAVPSIVASFRGQHALLFSYEASRRQFTLITGYGIAPEHLDRFFAALNAGHAPPQMLAISEGTAVRTSAVHPDQEFARSALYNEAIRPIGGYYATAASLTRSTSRDLYLIVARSRGKPDFDGEDVTAMNALIPHLAKAARLGERLESANLRAQSANSVLDQLQIGVILVDASAKVLFANRFAEILLDRRDALTTGKDGLRAFDNAASRRLLRLITRCAEVAFHPTGPEGSIDIPRDVGRSPLHVLVAPARSETSPSKMTWLESARPAAILLVTDPERERHLRKEWLRSRYALTEAEADVALESLQGDGRDAVAARLGVSMTTVRTHLGQIFEKTGARRQAELVSLLMRDKFPGRGR